MASESDRSQFANRVLEHLPSIESDVDEWAHGIILPVLQLWEEYRAKSTPQEVRNRIGKKIQSAHKRIHRVPRRGPKSKIPDNLQVIEKDKAWCEHLAEKARNAWEGESKSQKSETRELIFKILSFYEPSFSEESLEKLQIARRRIESIARQLQAALYNTTPENLRQRIHRLKTHKS